MARRHFWYHKKTPRGAHIKAPDNPTYVEPYRVEPCLMMASDHDTSYIKGFLKILEQRFREGAVWWEEKTGSKFNVGAAKVYISNETQAQLEAHDTGNNLWFFFQRAAHTAGVIDNLDEHVAHYTIIPFVAAGGGMVGMENFDAPFVWPGVAAISGKEALVLFEEDPTEFGFAAPVFFFDEQREATGALMHELGHVFVGLHHTDSGTIMFNYWDYPSVGFSESQINLPPRDGLVGSPFLT